MFSLFSLAGFLAWGEPQPNETIIVEAHKDLEIFVAPTTVSNSSDNININFHEDVIWGYASAHFHNAKIKNERGTYEPLLLNNEKPMFYNETTIDYVWEGCDYKKDPKKCSFENNHYLLESHIVIDDSQLVLTLYLIDPDLQIISRSTITDDKVVKYIKQQEELVEKKAAVDGPPTTNCFGGACSTVPQTRTENETSLKKKEELPLKWEISPTLLNKHFHQASLLLWSSTRFDSAI